MQLPESLPEPNKAPAVHSWEPLVTQQESQFQKWLKQEQRRIKAYNGPNQHYAAQRGEGHETEPRRQSLKPMHFQLPDSVTKGLSVKTPPIPASPRLTLPHSYLSSYNLARGSVLAYREVARDLTTQRTAGGAGSAGAAGAKAGGGGAAGLPTGVLARDARRRPVRVAPV